MFEIVRNKKPIDIICLGELDRHTALHSIIIAQKRCRPWVQSILVCSPNGVYFWNNFYLKNAYKRSKYDTLIEAVESRFKKDYYVYVLDNKTDLKEAIRPRGKAK